MSDAILDEKGIVVTCGSCGQRNRIPYTGLTSETRCGKCGTPLALPAGPIDAPDAASFDSLLAASPLPIVVDFWAPWCGPCRMVAPEIARVAAAHAGEWLIVKVNTDDVTELGDRFRIMSIPTMAVFAGGQERARTAGARPAPEIEAFVRSATRS